MAWPHQALIPLPFPLLVEVELVDAPLVVAAKVVVSVVALLVLLVVAVLPLLLPGVLVAQQPVLAQPSQVVGAWVVLVQVPRSTSL